MLGVKSSSGPADAGNGSHSSDASSNNHRYNVHSRYEFIRTLGKGTYGKVKLAMERYTGRKFAVKTLRKDRIKSKKDMLHIRREMKIMSSLHHPNIIQIHEVFENPDKFVIVMEYAPKGELYDYLSSKKIDSVEESRIFFKQIVSAIQYCHKVGVVHRDLKLENILLGENYEIKIADFGLANLFKSDQLLETFCGSPLYASPEIVNGIAYVGPEVDSWSLGVLLYALVYGMMPFDGSDYNTLTRQISRGEYSRQTKHPDAADLIAKMLTVDPFTRATIEEIANHYWLTQSGSALSQHTPSPVSVQQESRQVDTNANYLHSAPPAGHAYPIVTHLPSYTASPVQSGPVHQSPVSQKGQLSRTVLTPCALENCAHSNCPFLNRPKSILKPSNPRVKPPLQPTWQSQYAGFLPVSNHDMFRDVSCGLQAKDSLKLKAKPLGASGKRRVLRSKRDRESGYYSSPERPTVDILVPVQTPATVYPYTQPIIKSQLTTPVTSDNFKPRHPLQQESILTNQYCYVLPMVNHQPVPIIEGQSLSFYPSPTPITVNSTLEHGLGNTLPYTLTALNSEETQQKRGRPVSTYSDSSILSSDSFELCSFESELSSASYVATVANTDANTVASLTQAPHTPARPSTLPMTIPAGSNDGRCSPLPSGVLTPTSAELNHQLSQILSSNKPRRNHYQEPSVLGDEQEDQLRKMMNQLNLDLERACQKAPDVKVSLTASAEV